MWYYYIVVFIESAAFTKRLRALADVEENNVLRGIQNDLIEAPARGDFRQGLVAFERDDLETLAGGKENVVDIATSTCILSIGNISTSSLSSIRMSKRT
jgi:hypothetical protein